jgi:hypothetical protein
MPDHLYGELAQMGERRPCKAEVTGSNPVFSIRDIKELPESHLQSQEQQGILGRRLLDRSLRKFYSPSLAPFNT